MNRRKPLKRDTDAAREFLQRGRQPLARGEKGLARGEGLRRKKTPAKGSNSSDRPKRPLVPVGPLSPREWRRAVWELDGGRCVMCGERVPRDASSWVWNAHHPIEKQKLPPEKKYDPRNGVVACFRCHERHTNAFRRIPMNKLPGRCREFAATLGERGLFLLESAHPREDPAAGTSRRARTGEQHG